MGSSPNDWEALPLNARPMRDLLLLLPRLEVTETLEVDYTATDAALLLLICDEAEATMETVLRGLSTIGMLLANATPEIETGEIGANAIEALGWFIGELGEFSAACHCLAAAGRRYVADYQPDVMPNVEGVKL